MRLLRGCAPIRPERCRDPPRILTDNLMSLAARLILLRPVNALARPRKARTGLAPKHFDQSQVHGELPAMVDDVVENRIPHHRGARQAENHLAVPEERPRRHPLRIAGPFHGGLAGGHALIRRWRGFRRTMARVHSGSGWPPGRKSSESVSSICAANPASSTRCVARRPKLIDFGWGFQCELIFRQSRDGLTRTGHLDVRTGVIGWGRWT